MSNCCCNSSLPTTCSTTMDCINKNLTRLANSESNDLVNFCTATSLCINDELVKISGGSTSALSDFLSAITGSLRTIPGYTNVGEIFLSLTDDVLEWQTTITPTPSGLQDVITENPSLSTNNTITGGGNSLLYTGFSSIGFSSNGGSQIALSTGSPNSIVLSPASGNLIISGLLNSTSQNRLLGISSATSRVGYITIGGGLSLISGVLSAFNSGIQANSTLIDFGTDKRVIFDDGGVFGEDGNFLYDKALFKVSIGTSTAANVGTITLGGSAGSGVVTSQGTPLRMQGSEVSLEASAGGAGITLKTNSLQRANIANNGDITVASLNLAADSNDKMMVWNSSSKLVSYRAIPTVTATSLVFNATSDWGVASGGYYSIAFTHNLGSSDVVPFIWDETSTPVATSPEIIERTNSNTITIKVPSSPDNRFAGRIIVI